MRAVDGALNRVSVVINHKNERRVSVPDIRADFLNGHLQRTFADEEDDSFLAVTLDFSRGGQRAETRADGEANGRPVDLCDEAYVFGKHSVRYAVLRRACFGEYHVARAREPADSLPYVGLRDRARLGIVQERCLDSVKYCSDKKKVLSQRGSLPRSVAPFGVEEACIWKRWFLIPVQCVSERAGSALLQSALFSRRSGHAQVALDSRPIYSL